MKRKITTLLIAVTSNAGSVHDSITVVKSHNLQFALGWVTAMGRPCAVSMGSFVGVNWKL